MKKVIIGVVVALAVVAFVVANLIGKKEKSIEVETAVVAKRNLKAVVTASGQIQPKKSVNVSANTIGQIVELAVAEGDSVEKGQLLVRVDPRGPASTKAQASAALRAARANLELYKANLEEAKTDLERVKKLHERGLASDQEMISTKTAYDVAVANVAAARGEVARQDAALSSAEYEMSKVTISAEMSGVVTRLNVEEGENVIMGTMNNAGTVLMTIADLSHMEAEVLVDETDVVDVELGQEASIKIDAFPDTTFKGRVAEIGHSAIVSSGSFGREESADFKVKVALLERVPHARPGLSASADIVTAVRDSVAAIPIQALTIRAVEREKLKGSRGEGERPGGSAAAAGAEAASGEQAGRPGESVEATEEGGGSAGDGADREDGAASGEKKGARAETAGASAPRKVEKESSGARTETSAESKVEVEGVFVVEDGRAVFKPCRVGIAGEKHFEVVSGVKVGDEVIKGPFKVLRKLKDGAKVKVAKKKKSGKD